jgi:dihydroflavonol-4-reductase
VTHRPPAGTVEGVRIALRSQPLSIEKSRRDLGYAPNPIGPALRETVASFVGCPGEPTSWSVPLVGEI